MKTNFVPYETPSIVICPENPYVKLYSTERQIFMNLTFNDIFSLLNNVWQIANQTNDIRRKSRLSFTSYAYELKKLFLPEDFELICKYNNDQICNSTTFMINDFSHCVKIDVPIISPKPPFSSINFIFGLFSDAALDSSNAFLDTKDILADRKTFITFQSSNEYPDFSVNRIFGYRQHMAVVYTDIRIQELFQVGNSCLKNPSKIEIISTNSQIGQFSYTKSLCLMIKKQNFIRDNCNCYSETLPVERNFQYTKIENIPFCHKISRNFLSFLSMSPSVDNITQTNEYLTLINNSRCHDNYLSLWQDDGNCKPTCITTSYIVNNVAYNQWPVTVYSDSEINYLLNIINRNINYKMSKYNVTAPELNWSVMKRLNFLIMSKLAGYKVIPSKPFGISILEQESYPLANFLSSFGAILGLWIGMSVISIFEILEFLITICHMKFAK